MANRYWVGGTATWDATAGSKWATTSGGAGGAAVPTAADDVFLDAASGAVTITTSGTRPLRSLTCTGFIGTLTESATTTWNVGDASGGAFLLVAGMTYTRNSASSSWNFLSTSDNGGTGWSITTAGKTMPAMTFNGAGGKWVLQDSLTATGATITLTAGTLDTNSQTVTCGVFSSSNSNTRTLTLGSSSVTCTGGGNSWNCATITSLTVTSNTASVTQSGASASGAGAIDWNGLSLVQNGSGASSVWANATVANYTRTGTAVKTDSCGSTGTNFTVTGTMILAGNSTINRLLVQSSTIGANRNFICNGTVTASNVDFLDITGAGSASWNLSAITGGSGDCGGNSGITFTTPATQTHTTSAGGNWSDVTKWTSRVPLPQDNVIVNSNTTGTLTADMPRMGANIDFTGFAATFTANGTPSLFGNLTWSSGMSAGSGNVITLAGRSTHTITSNGKSIGHPLTVQAPGGSYTLQDALSTGGTFAVNDGTFDTNNQPITANAFQAASTRTSVVNLGTSTLTLTSTTAISIFTTQASATTLNGSSATVIISTASTNTRTVLLNTGQTLGTLTYTVALSPGLLNISVGTGAGSTITTLNVGSGRSVASTIGRTLNVNNWNVNGTANGYLYLPGVTGNYTSAPSIAAYASNLLDIRVKIALDTWGRAARDSFAGRWDSNGPWALTTNGSSFRLDLHDSAAVNQVSTKAIPVTFVNGVARWLRVTVDATTATYTVKWYESTDGSSWSQIGATDSFAAAAGLAAVSSPLYVGSYSSANAQPTAGGLYRAQIRNNILDDGTGIVFDADFTTHNAGSSNWSNATKTQFTESSANAATVTINGSLAQVGDGRVALTSSTPGSAATLSKSSGIVSSSYLSIQDSTATGGASWHALSSINVSNNSGWIFTTPPSTTGNFTIFGGPN